MLVTSRLNRLSFAMGMGYNSASGITDGYLVFPYPFFVAVPGFEVRAKGLSGEERARNLATLKFIGQQCARRGLNFQLGVWTLAYASTLRVARRVRRRSRRRQSNRQILAAGGRAVA